MNTLTYITSIIAVIAIATVVIDRMLAAKHKATEQAKRDILLQLLKQVRYGIVCSQEAVNLVVQSTKRNDCSAQEVANLGRMARGQLGLLLEEVEIQETKLSTWKFGKLFDGWQLPSAGAVAPSAGYQPPAAPVQSDPASMVAAG